MRRTAASRPCPSVRSVDADGRLVLADGSTLHSRQVVHGYAMTSHAAQGLTVDHVFIAGAVSREGLYVSATRGREGIRIFVPDRETFLDTAGLKSEARVSALEFLRANDALLPPGLPDWMQPLRRSLRYFALVRQRTTPSYEPSGDPPRPAPAVQHRQSARIGV